MTDIGILGLDTSHGKAFAQVLRDRGESADRQPGAGGDADRDSAKPSITAVWDSGSVRDDEYVAEFCADVDATRYDDPAAMVDVVDAAMILTVDWDRHVSLATPFLEAGVPTLIDKPIAGRLADLETLERASRTAPVYGGSAVPFHPEFGALPGTALDRTLALAGYNDFFYYRVHTVDTARRIVGADWTRVSPCRGSSASDSSVHVAFEDGTEATLRFDGPSDPGRFAVLDVADETRTVQVEAGEQTHRAMYERFLDEFLAVCAGSVEPSSVTVLDGARLLLGVEAALEVETSVTPDAPELADVDRPSAQFVTEYEPYY